jgi:hypothetical protein
METLNQWQHYARVRDWATARDWILSGRSKIHRPLYDSNASVAFVDPTNTNSDIVINWRYRHINPHYYTVRDYLVKYHPDGTATISPSGGLYPSCRRIMKRYTNLIEIKWVGKQGKYIIKQPDDPIVNTKNIRICSCCTGCGKQIYTCSNGIGFISDARYKNNHQIGIDCEHFEQDDLRYWRDHITSTTCTKCSGSGKTIPLHRYRSFKWDGISSLKVNIRTSKLILEEEPCL